MLGGSSRVNEGMGVNRPSVEALKPDHRRRNLRHMQYCRKRQERKCGGGRGGNTHDRDCRRKTRGTLGIQGVLNKGEGE
jgi:hypothetical protein